MPILATISAKAIVARGADKAFPRTVRRSNVNPKVDSNRMAVRQKLGLSLVFLLIMLLVVVAIVLPAAAAVLVVEDIGDVSNIDCTCACGCGCGCCCLKDEDDGRTKASAAPR